MKVFWEHLESKSGMWNVKFSNVDGNYVLTGPYPVQAVGKIQNIDFCFHSKGNQWELETNDEKGGLFPAEDKRAFQKRGIRVGKRGNQRVEEEMTHHQAAKIIAECVAEFVSQISDT